MLSPALVPDCLSQAGMSLQCSKITHQEATKTRTQPLSTCLTCDLSPFSFSPAGVMFSKATANLVRQIDPEGSLIYVSRVNDSKKLVPMALVVKRNHPWLWQKPKYHPTDFTLGDLLQGDEVLHPGV